MLSPKTRLMLQDILARLSRSEEVSLKETSVTGFKDHQDGFAAVDGHTLISTAVR